MGHEQSPVALTQVPDRFDRWLRAMAEAIQARADLLTVVLPRVSPEYVAIALGLHGLLLDIGDGPFDVKLEAPFHDGRRGKCDVVIAPRTGGAPFYFEFKSLWPRGAPENTTGIRKDLAKLAGLDGAVVAFSFALSDVPKGCERRLCKDSVEWAIEQVSDHLERRPVFTSAVFDVKGNGVTGRACLVAWHALPCPA